MNDFGEGVGDVGQSALAEHFGDPVEGVDFREDLDLVDGVAGGGVADAETVDGEGAETEFVDSDVGVAVVVVVVGEIPISA